MSENIKPMLIHVSPKIIQHAAHIDVELVDVSIPELDIVLRNNVEIVTRKPYPNKYYHVACRKVGKKAINGIIVESDKHLNNFQVVTRWKVDDEKIVTHIAEFNVVDNDYNLVTDVMMLWGNLISCGDEFSCRTPESMMNYSPLEAQPVMKAVPDQSRTCAINAVDHVVGGLNVERKQIIDMPTIEPERFDNEIAQSLRVPSFEHAFKVGDNNE